jgi:hypothetical protein
MEFLKDVSGLIDFTVRNGLNPLFALEVLIHDLKEIRSTKGGLQEACAQGFKPKASGWAEQNEAAVGESEEPMA